MENYSPYIWSKRAIGYPAQQCKKNINETYTLLAHMIILQPLRDRLTAIAEISDITKCYSEGYQMDKNFGQCLQSVYRIAQDNA